MMPALPQEILEGIVDAVASTPSLFSEKPTARPTLASLCLTSRSFYPRASFQLYYHIDLNTRDVVETLSKRGPPPGRIVRSLSIRRFILIEHRYRYINREDDDSQETHSALQMVFDMTIKIAHTLKRLMLDGPPSYTKTLALDYLLAYLPNLRDVIFFEYESPFHWELEQGKGSINPSLSVRRLALYDARLSESESFYEDDLWRRFPKLEIVVLASSHVAPHVLGDLLKAELHLQSIVIIHHCEKVGNVQPWRTGSAVSALAERYPRTSIIEMDIPVEERTPSGAWAKNLIETGLAWDITRTSSE